MMTNKGTNWFDKAAQDATYFEVPKYTAKNLNKRLVKSVKTLQATGKEWSENSTWTLRGALGGSVLAVGYGLVKDKNVWGCLFVGAIVGAGLGTLSYNLYQGSLIQRKIEKKIQTEDETKK